MTFRIDPEFKDYLGALDDESKVALEQSLMAEGCRDALIVWPQGDGDPILLDGHNRHAICEDLGIPYRVVECPVPIADREGAVAWIVQNQRARRNLTPDQLRYVRGKLQHATKNGEGGCGANQHSEQLRKNCVVAQKNTSKKLAEQFGVSPRTIDNDAKFAHQVDEIATEHGPAAKVEILASRKKVADYAPPPEPEPPAEAETPIASAAVPESTEEGPLVSPEDNPPPDWLNLSDSDHVQWMARNLKATGDSGLRPGPVHFSDTVSENLIDPEKAESFATTYMAHLCELERRVGLLPSALEREAPAAEQRETLKNRLARLVDALQAQIALL